MDARIPERIAMPSVPGLYVSNGALSGKKMTESIGLTAAQDCQSHRLRAWKAIDCITCEQSGSHVICVPRWRRTMTGVMKKCSTRDVHTSRRSTTIIRCLKF